MGSTRSGVGIAFLVALLLAPLVPFPGPTQVALAQTADPPGRVGRLSYIEGQVSFAPAGVNQWAPAVLNYPLTTGSALWTDAQARAEVHVGSTAIRMDQYTELDILNLDDQTVQLRVPQGTLEISLFQISSGERFEVATPTASVTLVQAGRYRFEAGKSDVRLTVWSGQAEFAIGSYAIAIAAVQTVLIGDPTAGGPVYRIIPTPTLDEFGRWSLARHEEEQRALLAATEYASPMMPGVGDLAAHGTWRSVAGYGWGWFPRVPANWAPYRFGRWVWISSWGWTWVDNSPWGFAPFHYGRWILIGGQWCWIPGPIRARPVFVPALVVFFVIDGVVGWFPLSPWDVYIPPYYASQPYFQTVNITVINITIYNIRTVNTKDLKYAYRDHSIASTLVPQDQFAAARVIGPGLVSALQKSDLPRIRVLARAPIQPSIKSVLGNSEQGVASKPPRIVEQRPVVVRQTPPVVTTPSVPGVEDTPRVAPVRRAAEGRTAPVPPTPAAQGSQDRANPAGQHARGKPFSCDPRSPIYDPRQCPPPAPQQRTVRPPAPQPRPTQPAAPPPQVAPRGPQDRPNPAGPHARGKPYSCDPRSPIYDPQQCPPQAPGR